MSVWLVFALGLFAGIYTGSLYVRMKYALRMTKIMQGYQEMIERQKNNHELEKRVEEEVRKRLDRLVGDVFDESKQN
jgi:uncharacterized membrane-anchored protein YhcB (DUF1043 family)